MPISQHTSNKLAYFVNADKMLLLNVNISTGMSQKVTCRHADIDLTKVAH